MRTRRAFLAGSAAMGAAMMVRGTAAQTKAQRLFLGTANTSAHGGVGPGIFVAEFADGRLSQPELAATIDSPGFLAVDKGSDVLFAQAMAAKPGAAEQSGRTVSCAVSYRIGRGHRLTEIGRALSDDGGGCHVGVSHDGRAVFVSNYGPGNVSTFLADANGRLTESGFLQFPAAEHGPDKERQEGAHAHAARVSPDGEFVFVNDLGCDRIRVFRLDHATATLQPHRPDHWAGTPGAGPRHLVFHSNGRWVYNINEMGSSIDVLEWNRTHGTLTTKQTVSTLPAGSPGLGRSRSCEMAFSSDERFLYASNRVHQSFAVFAIDPANGSLTFLQERMNPGVESRHIALDPTGHWLLSANQFSGDVSIFPVDTTTGKLGERTGMVQIAGVSCLVFA